MEREGLIPKLEAEMTNQRNGGGRSYTLMECDGKYYSD